MKQKQFYREKSSAGLKKSFINLTLVPYYNVLEIENQKRNRINISSINLCSKASYHIIPFFILKITIEKKSKQPTKP